MERNNQPEKAGAQSTPQEKQKPASHPAVYILIFFVLIEGAAIAYFYARERAQSALNRELRRTVDEAKETLTSRNLEINARVEDLNKLKISYARTEEERNKIQRDLKEKQAAISDFEKRLRESVEGGEETKANLERQKQIVAYLGKRLKESKLIELKLMSRLETMLQKKVELETKIANLKETLGASSGGTIGIPLQETTVSEPSPEVAETKGQILIANNRYNFIIVNLGSEDNVSLGDELIIEKNGMEIGRAKVKKLYKKMCLADIIPETKKEDMENNLPVKLVTPSGPGTAQQF